MFSSWTRDPEAFETDFLIMQELMRPTQTATADAEVDELNVGFLMRRDGLTREEAENELEMIHVRSDAY